MIPEIGHFSLILAFCLMLSSTHFVFSKTEANLSLARAFQWAQCICITLSALTLLISFSTDDFSVAYVAQHSNTGLPWYYKLTALWGSHEGSMLLWLWVLSIWSVFLSVQRSLRLPLITALGLLSLLQVGFTLFILATSNPFLRHLPNVPIEGGDLNPFLQDFAFVIHPPILYLGYVGLSMPFVLSLSAIWHNAWSPALVKCLRMTALLSWSFLTLGITLGSWWAYYELGWGGWWFWDPVENTSLMPWLMTTALLHLVIVYEKRGAFLGTLAWFAVIPFLLSLLGTFLVRSGILSSVHAFASDPNRGAYLLSFLALITLVSLVLIVTKLRFKPVAIQAFSKEMMLITQVFLFFVLTATLLLGTIYPIVIDVILGEKLSVGSAYFNAIMVPIFFLALIVMTQGPFVYWGVDRWMRWKRPSIIGILVLLFSGICLRTLGAFNWAQATAVSLSLLIAFGLVRHAYKARWSFTALFRPMVMGHLGVVVTVIGIALSTSFDTEKDVSLGLHEKVQVGSYIFELKDLNEIKAANYEGVQAQMAVYREGRFLTSMLPEKRYYPFRDMALSEAAIEPGLFTDLYIALGEPLGEAWSMRIYVKPFVRWIWAGGLFMAFSGFVSAWSLKRKAVIASTLNVCGNSKKLKEDWIAS